MITTFGGAVEDNETPTEGAIRELGEETNLKPESKDLSFFKNFTKTEDDGTQTLLYIFLLKDINKEALEIYEGKGYVEIQKDDDLSEFKLSSIGKEIVLEYFNKGN